MNEPYPALPPEIGRALDRIEGGAISWDPVLIHFLRARCFEHPDGRAQFRHRRHLYRCETRLALVQELLHPKTDVLAPGPIDMAAGFLQEMPTRTSGSGEPDDARTLFRDRCRNTLADWRPGGIRSLERDVHVFARLLLEQAGVLPPPEGPEGQWVSAWLALARETAFQPTVLSRREQAARSRVKRRAERDFRGLRHDGQPDEPDGSASRIDPGLLWHAGPACELALYAPFWVITHLDMDAREIAQGALGDWVRRLIVTAWHMLPPCWLQSRETRYEFRLSTERVPAKMRFLFGPALHEESFVFDRLHEFGGIHPGPGDARGPASLPFSPAVLERISILFEEILATGYPVAVPGGAGWLSWEEDLPKALTESLPIHLHPPPLRR